MNGAQMTIAAVPTIMRPSTRFAYRRSASHPPPVSPTMPEKP